MADYQTLDGTVNSLAPYRSLADQGKIEINGKRCSIGSSEEIIHFEGKQYVISSKEKHKLDGFDEEIKRLESKRPTIKREYSTTLLYASCGLIISGPTFFMFPGYLGYLISSAILGSLSLRGISLDSKCAKVKAKEEFKNNQTRIEQTQQQKQQYLENLIMSEIFHKENF